jgi:hypothetical protein
MLAPEPGTRGRMLPFANTRIWNSPGLIDMLRTATPNELKKPLGEIFSDLEAASDSLLIREGGQAVAALITGADYEAYREWIASRAWSMVEETREQNAHLSSDEIGREVDRIVDRVRSEPRATRAAS